MTHECSMGLSKELAEGERRLKAHITDLLVQEMSQADSIQGMG